jgi:hypothetical protein
MRISLAQAAQLGLPVAADVSAPSARRPDTKASNDLVAACLHLLALHGVRAWRNNTTGVFDPERKRFRTFSGRKGVSDILGIIPPAGRLVAVECKSGKGKLSSEQRAFLDDIAAAGGVAVCARSLDDLQAALAAAGVGG